MAAFHLNMGDYYYYLAMFAKCCTIIVTGIYGIALERGFSPGPALGPYPIMFQWGGPVLLYLGYTF